MVPPWVGGKVESFDSKKPYLTLFPFPHGKQILMRRWCLAICKLQLLEYLAAAR